MVKKIVEQEKLISSGKMKTEFPKDGTPEQQAAWRKENAIPEKPEAYDTKLPDGMVIGERDKPIVDNMLKTMHARNLDQGTVTALLQDYFKQEQAFLADRETQIETHKATQDDELHKEWGAEYQGNVNRINSFLDTLSTESQDAIHGAVGADGYPILNNKNFLKDLNSIARQLNPTATVVPGSGGNQMQAVETEIAGLEKLMEDRQSEYWKGGKAATNQARLRDLYDWREKQGQRKST